jgi:hypothetical protein
VRHQLRIVCARDPGHHRRCHACRAGAAHRGIEIDLVSRPASVVIVDCGPPSSASRRSSPRPAALQGLVRIESLRNLAPALWPR